MQPHEEAKTQREGNDIEEQIENLLVEAYEHHGANSPLPLSAMVMALANAILFSAGVADPGCGNAARAVAGDVAALLISYVSRDGTTMFNGQTNEERPLFRHIQRVAAALKKDTIGRPEGHA